MLSTVNHSDNFLESVWSFSAGWRCVFQNQTTPRNALGICLGVCLENRKILYSGKFEAQSSSMHKDIGIVRAACPWSNSFHQTEKRCKERRKRNCFMHRFGIKSDLKMMVDKNSLQLNLLDIAKHTPCLTQLQCRRSLFGNCFLAAAKFHFLLAHVKLYFVVFWHLGNSVNFPLVGLNATLVFAVAVQDVLSPQSWSAQRCRAGVSRKSRRYRTLTPYLQGKLELLELENST